MNKKAFAGLFFLVFLAAFIFRIPGLGLRPMHHDEANQALKFGALLEKGEYRYDKEDHHGPSLYYLSLPFARVFGAKTLTSLSERSLRLVTVFYGIGTVLLFLLFTPAIGRAVVFWSALCLAFSPAMVYFSRFYTQETILVFFLIGFMAFLWRYIMQPSWEWALGAGFFAGMMYATKETSVIAFGTIAGALALALILRKGEKSQKKDPEKEKNKIKLLLVQTQLLPLHSHFERPSGARQSHPAKSGLLRHFVPRNDNSLNAFVLIHMILALAAAFFASLVLFTSFFQNPKGLLDSLLSFRIYFVRAGEGGFHIHPWFYYFQILAFSKGAARLLWSEAFILVLAVAGSVAAFKVRRSEQPHPSFLKFIFFYTVAATAVYSIIPYKTPWNLLPFYAGFILLAGSGAAFIFKACPKKYVRALILLFLAVGFLNLAVESYRANFLFPADPRSPYVYAQTSPDFLKLIRRVEDLASFDPDGKKMLIKVIASPYETWPLPWYLRSFDRVGYWKSTEEAGEIDTPPLIISSTEEAAKLESSLKDIYRSEYYGLRPGVLLTLHVRNDLWEKFLKKSHL